MSTSEAESGNTHQPTSRLLGLTWATGALAVFLWLLAIVGEVGDVVGHFPRGVVTLIAVMAGTANVITVQCSIGYAGRAHNASEHEAVLARIERMEVAIANLASQVTARTEAAEAAFQVGRRYAEVAGNSGHVHDLHQRARPVRDS